MPHTNAVGEWPLQDAAKADGGLGVTQLSNHTTQKATAKAQDAGWERIHNKAEAGGWSWQRLGVQHFCEQGCDGNGGMRVNVGGIHCGIGSSEPAYAVEESDSNRCSLWHRRGVVWVERRRRDPVHSEADEGVACHWAAHGVLGPRLHQCCHCRLEGGVIQLRQRARACEKLNR